MNDSDRFTEEEIQEFFAALVARGTLIVEGVESLRLLRKTIEQAIQRAGISVEWDPSSSVDMREWLGIVSLSALRWGIAGTALGLLLGGFSERTDMWCALGGGLGLVLGGLQGHRSVQSGLRLRAYEDDWGTVCVEVKVLPRGRPPMPA